MSNLFIGLGTFNAFLAVAAGAFGAHSLKASLTAYHLGIFHTAADYHFYHALGLIVTGILLKHDNHKSTMIAAWLMLTGIIIFSGSLYTLALTGLSWLGMITPFGGSCFLAAWLLLAYGYLFKHTT